MLATTPAAIASRARPSESVAAWTCEPTQSHPNGTPTQSTALARTIAMRKSAVSGS